MEKIKRATPFLSHCLLDRDTVCYESSHPNHTILLKLGEKSAEIFKWKDGYRLPITGLFDRGVLQAPLSHYSIGQTQFITGKENVYTIRVDSPNQFS